MSSDLKQQPEEYDYSDSKAYSAPKYAYRKILQESGSESQTLELASTSESRFELPGTEVFNLSKSFINFSLTIPAQGAAQFNFMHVGGLPFWNRVRLMTRSGVHLCDIPNLAVHARATLPATTKLEDFLCEPVADAAATAATAAEGGAA